MSLFKKRKIKVWYPSAGDTYDYIEVTQSDLNTLRQFNFVMYFLNTTRRFETGMSRNALFKFLDQLHGLS